MKVEAGIGAAKRPVLMSAFLDTKYSANVSGSTDGSMSGSNFQDNFMEPDTSSTIVNSSGVSAQPMRSQK